MNKNEITKIKKLLTVVGYLRQYHVKALNDGAFAHTAGGNTLAKRLLKDVDKMVADLEKEVKNNE